MGRYRVEPRRLALARNQAQFTTDKSFVRRPRGDSRRTVEQKREDEARRAAEIPERQAVFDVNDYDEGWALKWSRFSYG